MDEEEILYTMMELQNGRELFIHTSSTIPHSLLSQLVDSVAHLSLSACIWEVANFPMMGERTWATSKLPYVMGLKGGASTDGLQLKWAL